VSDLAFVLVLPALAAVTWWLTRSRESRPIILWGLGWPFLFTSMAVLLIGGDAAWPKTVIHLLGPFFPALVLAGTLAYAERPVPRWLVPLALVVGATRWILDRAGLEALDHGIALLFEAGCVLAAASIAFRVARRADTSRSQYLLAPAFLAVAVVEGADALSGVRSLGPTAPHLIAWVLVAPFALAIQIAVTRDRVLGQQRRVEQALGESEERFRALSDNAFDLVAEMDSAGRFTYANPRYEEWLGRPRETLTGTPALDLVYPEDHERTQAWFRAQSTPDRETLLTARVRHRDGGWRWVETSSGVYRAAGADRIVVNSRDVTTRMQLDAALRRTHEELEVRVKERTAQLDAAVASLQEEVAERHRVEHELRVSEERWRNLSELSSDMSYAVAVEPDGSLTLEWITQAVGRITGYSVDEINERGWRSLLHPEDVDRMAPRLSQIAEGKTREVEGRILTRDGEVRWLSVHVTGARSPVDGKLRVLGAIRDVTEAQRAEQESRRLEAQLLETQKLESLGILAGGVAHDFSNLLAVILGNETLARSQAQEGSRLAKQLSRIRSAAEHAKALSNQMLAYSGKASVSLKPLDLSELVEQTCELLEASTSKKCRLEISLQRDGTVVAGDPTQLRQVIMNLVTNASESLQDRPGRVTVRTGLVRADAACLARAFGGGDLAEGDYVYLEVSDTGEGMDEKIRKRIFEPYFSTKFAGRGLGLAAVVGIVRGHRGAIQLTTEPDEGTTFRILLPPATRAARPAPSAAPLRPAATAGGTILVVDDEAWVLELAREFLERGDFEVVTADGGREALEILRGDAGKAIDAVVLDLTMPDLDGRETFLEIRHIFPGLPVIVASGFSEKAMADRFPPDEIAAFVRKPYEPEELIDAIRTSLGG
jgi:PAS domain S-box-containing protein